jgi:hypothetical protein
LSVAVDVFTLVCISVERYIAICRPLLILKLQSLRLASFFNALILFFIWFLAFVTSLPNLLMYNLCSLPKRGRFKCEKVHSVYFDERLYMVALLGTLVVSRRDSSSGSLSFSLLLSDSDDLHARPLHIDHLQDISKQHRHENALVST